MTGAYTLEEKGANERDELIHWIFSIALERKHYF